MSSLYCAAEAFAACKEALHSPAPTHRSGDHAAFTHRITVVFDGPKLVGFAMMNAETFQLPEAIEAWDGKERLTSNAASLAETDMKGLMRRKTAFALPLAHLSVIGCSPFARRGLGSRLLRLQRAIAVSFGFPAGLMAIEAVKPLDTDYYALHGFQTTTPTFYPLSDTVSLVPMFTKLVAADAAPEPLCYGLAALASPAPVSSKDREAMHHALWPADHENIKFINEASKLLSAILNFMWFQKDHEKAAEYLRRITVRAGLEPVETAKLWSMRFHSMAYQKTAIQSRVPLAADSAWFRGAAFAVPDDVKALIAASCVR